MSEGPLISIVLPNRNHAAYLQASLPALLAQTFRNIEVWVVDDDSSDNSRDVVRGFAERDTRVRLITLPSHLGVNGAMREGLRAASGEFVYMAAADDLVTPALLEHSVKMLQQNPTAAFCFSDPSELIDATSERRSFPLKLASRPVFYAPEDFAELLARNYFHVSSQTILFRRAAFEKTGGYLDELEWIADWFLNHVAAFRHGVCYLPESLGFLRIRGDSLFARAKRDSAARKRVLLRILALLYGPAYADVRPYFRRAALLPEYHFDTFLWLMQTREGRSMLTPRLVWRLVTRALWSYVRPFAPLSLRRRLRERASAPTVI